MIEYNTNYSAIYTGKTQSRFKNNHTYLIQVLENRPYGIYIKAIYDETEDEDYDAILPYSNLTSLQNYWNINDL